MMSRAERRAMERARRNLNTASVDAAGPFAQMTIAEVAATGTPPPHYCREIWRNKRHFVFVCDARGGATHLMIQRLDGRDGMSWDELFGVKNALGFSGHEAVEIYPRGVDLHNVANVRHLWVLPTGARMAFGLDPGRRLPPPDTYSGP